MRPGVRLHYAWVIAAVTFVVIVLTAGVRAAPSVLIVPLEGEFQWSRATISFAVGVNLLLYGAIGPFAAAIMDRFGVRRTMCLAMTVTTAAVALSPLMREAWQLVLIWGVAVGLGCGFIGAYLSAYIAARWFRARQGLVIGVLTAGNAAGQLVFLPTMATLITHAGWRLMSLVLAGSVAAFVPVLLLLMREQPADLGLPYRSIRYSDPLGPMPAWLIPAAGSTWVISVHGLDSSRAEALRALPVLHNLGLPDMDIGYRNDAGAPSSPDHLYHLGASEWLDLQAAARYALSHGAHSLVLYGYSMGGNIVESFMAHSALATKVRAIVLDAPALDWYQILELAAEQRDLPGVFSAVVERVVACRIGLSSLDPIDHLVTQLRSVPPTLLFQGTADSLVPPRSNLEFARKYPRSVTIELFSGANHVQSWNVNPGRYDRVLSRFLRTHLGCSTAGCG